MWAKVDIFMSEEKVINNSCPNAVDNNPWFCKTSWEMCYLLIDEIGDKWNRLISRFRDKCPMPNLLPEGENGNKV